MVLMYFEEGSGHAILAKSVRYYEKKKGEFWYEFKTYDPTYFNNYSFLKY